MSDENEPLRAPMSEQEIEAGLDRFSEFVNATAPEQVIEWFDNEASDLLDGLWAAEVSEEVGIPLGKWQRHCFGGELLSGHRRKK